MSFDVYVRRPDDKDHEGYSSMNYTSNMGAFFAWALHGVETDDPTTRCDSRDAIFKGRHPNGLILLDGLSAPAAAAELRKALDRIDQTPSAALEKYNAPNGWGSHGGATMFLRSIYRACVDNPEGFVRVSM